MNKKTLVIGASINPERYANKAVKLLSRHGHEALALGKREGKIEQIEIFTETKKLEDIDTVSLYLNMNNQKDMIDYIIELRPNRVIFNPGTENPDAAIKFNQKGIETIEACTLVMLTTGQY